MNSAYGAIESLRSQKNTLFWTPPPALFIHVCGGDPPLTNVRIFEKETTTPHPVELEKKIHQRQNNTQNNYSSV